MSDKVWQWRQGFVWFLTENSAFIDLDQERLRNSVLWASVDGVEGVAGGGRTALAGQAFASCCREWEVRGGSSRRRMRRGWFSEWKRLARMRGAGQGKRGGCTGLPCCLRTAALCLAGSVAARSEVPGRSRLQRRGRTLALASAKVAALSLALRCRRLPRIST